MSRSREIQWAFLMDDGNILRGEGQDAVGPLKLADIAQDAVHARFEHPSGTLIYVAGPHRLLWTVQNISSWGKSLTGHMVQQLSRPHPHIMVPKSKALGLLPPSGSHIWLFPDGSIGVARTIESAGLAWNAFNLSRGE